MGIIDHINWPYMFAFLFVAWTALSSGFAVFVSRRFFPKEPDQAPLEPGHQVHPNPYQYPEARFEPRERSEA